MLGSYPHLDRANKILINSWFLVMSISGTSLLLKDQNWCGNLQETREIHPLVTPLCCKNYMYGKDICLYSSYVTLSQFSYMLSFVHFCPGIYNFSCPTFTIECGPNQKHNLLLTRHHVTNFGVHYCWAYKAQEKEDTKEEKREKIQFIMGIINILIITMTNRI